METWAWMNHLSRAFTSSTVPRLAGLRSKSGCQKNIFMERFSRTAVLFSRSSRRWFSSSDKEDSPTSTKKIVTKQPPKLSKREREILASLRLSSPQLAKKTSTTSPKVVDSTSRDIGAEIKELRKAKTSSSAHQCDFIPQALAVHHTNCLQNLILKSNSRKNKKKERKIERTKERKKKVKYPKDKTRKEMFCSETFFWVFHSYFSIETTDSLGESPLTIALLAKDTEYALVTIKRESFLLLPLLLKFFFFFLKRNLLKKEQMWIGLTQKEARRFICAVTAPTWKSSKRF